MTTEIAIACPHHQVLVAEIARLKRQSTCRQRFLRHATSTAELLLDRAALVRADLAMIETMATRIEALERRIQILELQLERVTAAIP